MSEKTSGSEPVPSSVPSSLAELGTRISAVADLYQSRKSAADAAGISTDQLARYMRGENAPSVMAVVGLAAGKSISLDWLVTGKGQMRAKLVSPHTYSQTALASPPSVREGPTPNYVYIPLYDVAARAGINGTVVEHEPVVDVLAFRDEFIRQELHAAPEDLLLLFIEGDSGVPDLHPGDIALVNKTDTSARREGTYILRMDGALLVKRLQRLPGSLLKVSSRNEAYEPFTVNLSALNDGNDFSIIGRVVWACRRF